MVPKGKVPIIARTGKNLNTEFFGLEKGKKFQIASKSKRNSNMEERENIAIRIRGKSNLCNNKNHGSNKYQIMVAMVE